MIVYLEHIPCTVTPSIDMLDFISTLKMVHLGKLHEFRLRWIFRKWNHLFIYQILYITIINCKRKIFRTNFLLIALNTWCYWFSETDTWEHCWPVSATNVYNCATDMLLWSYTNVIMNTWHCLRNLESKWFAMASVNKVMHVVKLKNNIHEVVCRDIMVILRFKNVSY